VALADREWLMPGDLFPGARRQTGESADGVQPLSLAAAREAAEKREIERALRRSSGQIGEAAKLLGVSRTTLWDRMRRFGMEG
jgi:transcriptional regulator of acetoin/glycerol metabolism